MPKLFVIAGPNGAGKSTSAPELLSGARQVAEFVNADVIQKEAGVSEIEAGRITLARLNALAEAGKDMARLRWRATCCCRAFSGCKPPDIASTSTSSG